MKSFTCKIRGILICLAIAAPAFFLGNLLPVVGGPVFAILIGIAGRRAYQG